VMPGNFLVIAFAPQTSNIKSRFWEHIPNIFSFSRRRGHMAITLKDFAFYRNM
jgi:hypothetical protein